MNSQRSDRLAGLVLACAMAALVPGAVARVAEFDATPSWWNLGVAVLLGVPFVGLVARAGHHGSLRFWAGAMAGVCWVGLASYPIVAEDLIPGGELPWIAMYSPTAAAALAVAAPLWRALTASVLFALTQAWVQNTEYWHPPTDRVVTDAVFAVATTAAVAVVMEAVRSRTRMIATAQEESVAAIARVGARQVALQETVRWDALVHDDVLAALRAAATPAVTIDEVHLLVTRAIERLRSDPHGAPMTTRTLREQLEVLAASFGIVDTVSLRCDDRDEPVSPAVVVAVMGATEEALRNVARHAGGASTRVVRTTLTGALSPQRIEVRIQDDGVGFMPHDVPVTRLGLALSISARLHSVGGSGEVSSRPGEGTEVVLLWPATPAGMAGRP